MRQNWPFETEFQTDECRKKILKYLSVFVARLPSIFEWTNIRETLNLRTASTQNTFSHWNRHKHKKTSFSNISTPFQSLSNFKSNNWHNMNNIHWILRNLRSINPKAISTADNSNPKKKKRTRTQHTQIKWLRHEVLWANNSLIQNIILWWWCDVMFVFL